MLSKRPDGKPSWCSGLVLPVVLVGLLVGLLAILVVPRFASAVVCSLVWRVLDAHARPPSGTKGGWYTTYSCCLSP